MFAPRSSAPLHLALVSLIAASLISPARPAAAVTQAPDSATEGKTVMKIAVTPQDHLDKAVEYRKKAAAYREEANAHREMIQALKSRLPPDTRQGSYEPPELKKLRAHCDGYIQAADALAAKADKMAEYHEMRAAELKGQ